MGTEIWKEIEGYELLYSISNFGRVRSLRKGSKIMKQSLNSCGYPVLCLAKNGVNEVFKIHSLLANHFIPNPENKRTVNHKNGIKSDNRLENLEWLTHAENINHAFDMNLSRSGERSYKAKITKAKVVEIFNYKPSGFTVKQVATKFEVPYAIVYKIWAGLAWKRTTGQTREIVR